MSLDAPALYLECRYDRAAALRVIISRLRWDLHQAHDTWPRDPALIARLRTRYDRAHRHLAALGGDL